MERDTHGQGTALVELGSVTADTKGDGGLYWELGGLQPHPGLSAD
jgi:hypothetical protein